MDRRKLTKDLPETENFNFSDGLRSENAENRQKPDAALAIGC
jgi:hypothetical protein